MGAFLLLLGMGGVALWAVNKGKTKAKKAGGGYVPPGPGTPYPSPGHVIQLNVGIKDGWLVPLRSDDPSVFHFDLYNWTWVIKTQTLPVRYAVHAVSPGISKIEVDDMRSSQLIAGESGSLDLVFETTEVAAQDPLTMKYSVSLAVTYQKDGQSQITYVRVRVLHG